MGYFYEDLFWESSLEKENRANHWCKLLATGADVTFRCHLGVELDTLPHAS
jgi:hypothetical protein